MSGLSSFLLSFCVLGHIFFSSRAWHVNTPSNVRGLVGSCLVIPCSFDYHYDAPLRPDHVVWYQYVNHKYPLVYDNSNPDSVISIFRGKTRLLRPTNDKTCTLEIYPVTWSHHRQKIYPWVDPENVGKSSYRFYDNTVTIEVVGEAEKPTIVISGDVKVGHSVEVECTIYHTCPTRPPRLGLNIPVKKSSPTHSSMSNGISRTTLKTTVLIERDHQTVECSVNYTGGLTATASETLNPEKIKNIFSVVENYSIIILGVAGVCAFVIVGVICFFLGKKCKRSTSRRGNIDLRHMPNNLNSECCTEQKLSMRTYMLGLSMNGNI